MSLIHLFAANELQSTGHSFVVCIVSFVVELFLQIIDIDQADQALGYKVC